MQGVDEPNPIEPNSYHHSPQPPHPQLDAPATPPPPPQPSHPRLVLKLKPTSAPSPMALSNPPPATRRSTRQATAQSAAQSGSEYAASQHSSSPNNDPMPEDEEHAEPVVTWTSSRGRKTTLKRPTFAEDDDDEEEEGGGLDDEDDAPVRPAGRTRKSVPKRLDFIEPDEDENEEPDASWGTRLRTRRRENQNSQSNNTRTSEPPRPQGRTTRNSRRSAQADPGSSEYVQEPDHVSEEEDVEDDDAPPTSPSPEPAANEEPRGYKLRKRGNVNYTLPPPLDPMDITSGIGNNSRGPKGKAKSTAKFSMPRWNLGAKTDFTLGMGMGMDIGRVPPVPDDSDSDNGMPPAPKPFSMGGAADGGAGLYPAGANSANAFIPNDFGAAAGAPSNLGKVSKDSALADADPLGVNTNVTFDEVGGLDDHITSLKEMVSLPLLYPEVFQQFNLTPPRGVLFHGPPGTGKTLLARALAASSRNGDKTISFFMRKGADCLSKWVGEAERQLRLLFEEARACQPSIIFFDEIDGLAPVRSSKQDQIHASIVSTLLALMDGMDGRGQVIVIGATNRPDSIDPALRRPGRFDREFYFPLPGLDARQRILSIITRGWKGWENDNGNEALKMLAEATKGYGGADLRALCTEAALNAVQRRYPQIYKSSERLLLKPETIVVQPRDFMVSLKKLIPSSARSTASAAAPLPEQLVPLLGDTLELVKQALDSALPSNKKRSALEEAEWEDEGGEEAGFAREMMLQAMETLRVHRPRLLLHGVPGMGQNYIGAAAMHHLEGYHIQCLDLGTLFSDSTRSIEATIVQLFVEAKRHKPSVIYIPSLRSWSEAVSETARTTVRTMLESLSPTDPILLLCVVDGAVQYLPRDVQDWFGPSRESVLALTPPTLERRRAFFENLLHTVEKPPNQFPDIAKRRKRVLEKLPIAPPLPPRMPTKAEMAAQEENDARVKALLTNRLGPILSDLKKKFKRFTKTVYEEYGVDPKTGLPPVDLDQQVLQIVMSDQLPSNGGPIVVDEIQAVPVTADAPPAADSPKRWHDIDLEKMHAKLYYQGYLTPQGFLADLSRIIANAENDQSDADRLFKAQQMYHAAHFTLLSWGQQFSVECDRMAQREKARRRELKKSQEKEGSSMVNGATAGAAPRRSPRHNGQQPEVPMTDPTELERKLKRQRTEGENSQSPMDEDSGPKSPKRVRISPAEEDADAEGEADPLDTTMEEIHPPVDSLDVPPPPAPEIRQPSPTPSLVPPPSAPVLVNGIQSRLSSRGPSPLPTRPLTPQPEHPPTPAAMEEVEMARTPSPPPPPFQLDPALLAELSRRLANDTGGLTIEQLEQLRASCLNAIWRRRGDWDRGDLLRDLLQLVQEYVEGVSSAVNS
ncbi:hypothetical protein BOTBODRAFT_593884 [Botryobasidium botryosum FD-172 SS1]|uniref:AAA+ ATPase domain-containing protein n=1 Tax=Botryobasidium botryosum (strain FD-172 SS1) TaxID=930990 RepID=A0A067M869_BOTB1|nr:hypothetical protein BOTBODRAFT_593884 [Botryobasidium botryosum FD-172 SS1]